MMSDVPRYLPDYIPGIFGRYYDACSAAYTTVERIQVLRFTQPYQVAPMTHFYVRKGAYLNPKDVTNKRIGKAVFFSVFLWLLSYLWGG